jgi:hypothetical protein
MRFRSGKDRALASQLLNQLKLVSAREFEAGIEAKLTWLSTKVNSTIAVYPVIPPNPDGIIGYDPFYGGISSAREANDNVGRREQPGSEGRVAHIITSLQRTFLRGSGCSAIECAPTIKQLDSQGIRHIVFVDDVCGSGERLFKYWKSVVPKRIKSLLSLKRYELWIVLYASTPRGRKALKRAMPNFPIDDHLITVLPDADLQVRLNPELIDMCARYAADFGMERNALGFRSSACAVVFEHGCPNNLPAIIWSGEKRGWKGLFPNRAIPTDMRDCFGGENPDIAAEALWRVNQPALALSLLDALDHKGSLKSDDWMLLSLLGICMRGVTESELPARMLIDTTKCQYLLDRAAELKMYDASSRQVSAFGKEIVTRFRERYRRGAPEIPVGSNPLKYYPTQCEGRLR